VLDGLVGVLVFGGSDDKVVGLHGSSHCFGLVSVNVFGQTGRQEVDDRLGDLRRGADVPAPVKVGDRLPAVKPLQPKLGDAAIVQLVVGVLGVFGKHQRVEAMSVECSDQPDSSTGGPACFAGDNQIVTDSGELWFVTVGSLATGCKNPPHRNHEVESGCEREERSCLPPSHRGHED